jgi:phytanoyl-CoA hydroxylase
MGNDSSSITPYRVPDCPDDISEAHAKQYQKLGFVAFEGVLNNDEVEEANRALSQITRNLLNEAKSGKADLREASPKATLNYAGVRVQRQNTPFSIHFEAGVDPLSLSPDEAELKYRKLHGYHQEHPAFSALTEHSRIKGFLEGLIGQEMVLKGEMALAKPPMIGSEKPWHQDNAYFNWLPLHLVGTAWIALDDATIENGCMFVLPGGHKLGALKHHHTIDCEILPDRFDRSQAVPIELKAGGALFFSAMLPHQTPPNRTSTRRRALQFQYRGIDAVQVSKEEFGKVFAEADGTPASCALAYEDG